MDGLGSAKRSDTLSFADGRCGSLSFAEDNRERSRSAPLMLWVPPRRWKAREPYFSLRLTLRFRAILTASFYELR